jgi:hypothetical protein
MKVGHTEDLICAEKGIMALEVAVLIPSLVIENNPKGTGNVEGKRGIAGKHIIAGQIAQVPLVEGHAVAVVYPKKVSRLKGGEMA